MGGAAWKQAIFYPFSPASSVALNRHLTQEQEISIELRRLGDHQRLTGAWELFYPDMKAINTKDAPDNVSPARNESIRIDGHRLTGRFKPGSRNVIVTRHVGSA